MSFLGLIEEEYFRAVNTFSNINEHIELLYELGMESQSIVEIGNRSPCITSKAFLRTNAKLTTYNTPAQGLHDNGMINGVKELFHKAKMLGKDVLYVEYVEPLGLEIEECDLLFLNVWNARDLVSKMLERCGNKSQKFIALHNTHTYGVRDEKINWQDYPDKKAEPNEGLLTAVIEFLIKNRHWQIKEHRTNNNGLIVLERI